MKHKKLYIGGAAMIIAGAVVLGSGIALGGVPGFTLGRGGFRLNGHTGNDHVMEKTKIDPFQSLDLKVDYCEIEIIPSDDFYLEYAIYDGKEPLCETEDDTFRFVQETGGNLLNMDFFRFGGQENQDYINLYVPEDFVFDKLRVESGSGSVTAEDVKAEDMMMQLSYGDFKADRVEAGRAQLTLESGDFEAKDVLADSFRLSSGYGDVELDSAKIKDGGMNLESGDLEISEGSFETLDVENEYGEVTVGLLEDSAEYTMDLATEYGEIDAPKTGAYAIDEDEATYRSEGAGSRRITVYCESGDIEIFAR